MQNIHAVTKYQQRTAYRHLCSAQIEGQATLNKTTRHREKPWLFI